MEGYYERKDARVVRPEILLIRAHFLTILLDHGGGKVYEYGS